MLIYIEDDGEPGPGRDRMSWRPGTPFDAAQCPQDPALGLAADNVEEGNYIVHRPAQ